MKFIFKDVTEENHEECEEGWQCVVQKLCRRSAVCFGNFYWRQPK